MSFFPQKSYRSAYGGNLCQCSLKSTKDLPFRAKREYFLALPPLEFVCPHPQRNSLGGRGGGENLGGGNAPFAPHLSRP